MIPAANVAERETRARRHRIIIIHSCLLEGVVDHHRAADKLASAGHGRPDAIGRQSYR
jgi:hypothetical protein